MKKAFTLFELVLTVTLIGVIYFFVMISFDKFSTSEEISVENFLSSLKKEAADTPVFVKCLDQKEICLLFVDEELTKTIPNPFKDIVDVYSYSTPIQRIFFPSVEFNQRYAAVSFALRVDTKGFHNAILIQTQAKTYLLHPLYAKVQTFDSIDAFEITKQESFSEVKNAL